MLTGITIIITIIIIIIIILETGDWRVVYAVVRLTVLVSVFSGFSPMPQQGSSWAIASLNFGWETA